MSKFLFFAFGLPTLITALCATFVLVAPHCEQTIYLQLCGLGARLLIVVSFAYFVRQSLRVNLFSMR